MFSNGRKLKVWVNDYWKRKKLDKIVLLTKRKVSTTEALIFKDSIESYISHDEFASINNVLKEYDDITEAIKTPKTINLSLQILILTEFTDTNYARLKTDWVA